VSCKKCLSGMNTTSAIRDRTKRRFESRGWTVASCGTCSGIGIVAIEGANARRLAGKYFQKCEVCGGAGIVKK
jgi:hypothetical protein